MWSNWKLCILLVGMQNGAAAVKNTVEAPKNVKNRTTIQSRKLAYGYFIQKN